LKHLVELDGRPVTGHSNDSSEVLLCLTPGMLREALAGQKYGQPGEHSFLGDEQGETYRGGRRGSEECSGGWSRESSAGGEKRGKLTGGSGGGERGQSAGGGAEWREADAGVWDGVLGEVSDLVLEHRRLRGLQVSGRRASGCLLALVSARVPLVGGQFGICPKFIRTVSVLCSESVRSLSVVRGHSPWFMSRTSVYFQKETINARLSFFLV
jgi:hypothetical protein